MLGKPDVFQGFHRPLAAFASRDTGEGQCQLDVGQDGLVRDQVVGLENEANAVVAVGVPIARFVVLRRDSVDDQVAALEAIQAANDVEHCRFTRTRLAQNCDEFAISEGNRNVIERNLAQVCGFVDLDDISQLKHWDSFDR